MSSRVDSSGLRSALRGYAKDVLRATSYDLKRQAQYQAPVATGRTRDLIQVGTVTEAGNSFWIRLSCPTPQAKWQDDGTRPHDIWGSPFLAFEGRHGPVVRIADVKPFKHPGSTHYRGWWSDVMSDENATMTMQRYLDQMPRHLAA